MDKAIFEQLAAAGIDVDSAMERFMNNEQMYFHFLQKFAESPLLAELKTAIKNNDSDAAFSASHNLKSLTGNLSMIPLHHMFSTQVEHLRADRWEEAISMMEEIQTEHDKMIATINKTGILSGAH